MFLKTVLIDVWYLVRAFFQYVPGNVLTYSDSALRSSANLVFAQSVVVKAPCEMVFERVSNESRFAEWVPFYYGRVTVYPPGVSTNLVGKKRVMCLFGKVYSEEIITWCYPHQFSFSIQASDAHPFHDHLGVVTVTPNGSGQTTLHWQEHLTPHKKKVMGLIVPAGMHLLCRAGMLQLRAQLERNYVEQLQTTRRKVKE